MNKLSDRSDQPNAPPPQEEGSELPFIVELRLAPEPAQAKVLARLHSMAVAQAAYDAAVEERPGACIVLRQGDHVLRNSLFPSLG